MPTLTKVSALWEEPGLKNMGMGEVKRPSFLPPPSPRQLLLVLTGS